VRPHHDIADPDTGPDPDGCPFYRRTFGDWFRVSNNPGNPGNTRVDLGVANGPIDYADTHVDPGAADPGHSVGTIRH